VRFNDAITGAVLVVFAVAEIAFTRTFPSLHGQAYGPDLFPKLIGIGLFGCGCVLIVRGLLTRRASVQSAAQEMGAKWIDFSNISTSRHARTNAVLTLVFLLSYILLSDWIGFIPLSLFTLTVLTHRLGTPLYIAILVAILTTAVIQYLFAKILLVPLPAGLMQGIVW